jgi:hypothetical protein
VSNKLQVTDDGAEGADLCHVADDGRQKMTVIVTILPLVAIIGQFFPRRYAPKHHRQPPSAQPSGWKGFDANAPQCHHDDRHVTVIHSKFVMVGGRRVSARPARLPHH